MKSNLYITIFIGFLLLGCSEKNTCIKKWYAGDNLTPAFSPKSVFDDCSFIIKEEIRIADSIKSYKHRARICNKKFYIKPLENKAEEFIFLDLDSPKNAKRTIEIKCGKITKTYESVLENIIVTKGNITVRIFRIKKLAKLDDFFGRRVLDIVLLATEEYGIIGSYLNDNDGKRNVIVSERGDILRDYIDYSKYEFGELL